MGNKNFSDRIITYLGKHSSIDKSSEAILRFSIELVISSVFSLGLALIVAALLEIFPNVLLIMLTSGALRTFSGGAHSSTKFGCAFFGAIVLNILGMVTKHIQLNKEYLAILLLIIFIFSIWSLSKFAPADTPGKPISTKVKRKKLQRLSFLTVSVWCGMCLIWYTGFTTNYMLVYTSALGVLWQSFSLTPWGYALVHHMDRVMGMVNRKKGELV